MTQVFQGPGGGEAVYVLRRAPEAGRYLLDEQFTYRDPDHEDWVFTVPADVTTFLTDLASVPVVATWLVPKDGTHTPAALLHDALVREHDDPLPYEGPRVSREQADLIFRRAMQYLDVAFIRRWMMWAAVSLNTLTKAGPGRWHWYWRIFIPVVIGALLLTGFWSILDLVDIPRVAIFGRTFSTALPWMGDRPLGQELVGGFVAAAIAAVGSSLLWGRRWLVGAVAALVIIPFAFPLVVATFAYGVYFLAEVVTYGILKLLKGRVDDADVRMGPVVPPPALRRAMDKS